MPKEPQEVGFLVPDGHIARLIFDKRGVRADDTVRPSAFEPEIHPDLKRWETSVCGINGVPEERLLHLGATIRSDKKAIASTSIHVPRVATAGLQCEAAPEPALNYPEHCVIVGWAADDKSARLAAQQELAAAATKAKRFSLATQAGANP